MTKTAFVLVLPIINIDQLNSQDASVAGLYRVLVSEDIPEDALANAALDAFHYSVPVKVLDDFDFVVHADENLKVRLESGEYESYDFADARISVERIGDVKPIVAAAPKRSGMGRKP